MIIEDLFMDFVSITPHEKQDEQLDDLIEKFVGDGVLSHVLRMNLQAEESENFGCTVRQVAYDVVRHHLTQYWLTHRQAWYVKNDAYEGWWVEDNDDIDDDVQIVAGPFPSEERAQQALDALFEDHLDSLFGTEEEE